MIKEFEKETTHNPYKYYNPWKDTELIEEIEPIKEKLNPDLIYGLLFILAAYIVTFLGF